MNQKTLNPESFDPSKRAHLAWRKAALGALLLAGAFPIVAFATPPVNDDCSGALIIPSAGPFPYLSPLIDITNATSIADPPEPACSANIERSVWFQFTPSTGGLFTFSTTGDTGTTVNDTVLALYRSTGGCAGPLVEVDCNDDPEHGLRAAITTQVTAGVNYYVVIWHYSRVPLRDQTLLQLRVYPVLPAGNDSCATAEVIPGAGPFPLLTTLTDTTMATSNDDPPAPPCTFGNPITRGIWYTFTPEVTARYRFSTCTEFTDTSIVDTVLAIYTRTGDCSGPMTVTDCADLNNDCVEDQADLTVDLEVGLTYYIVVSEFDATPPEPPFPPTPGLTLSQVWVASSIPRITDLRLTGGTSLELTFSGLPGHPYTVERSTDLTNWSLVGSPSDLNTGFFVFIDADGASGPAQFYRVTSP